MLDFSDIVIIITLANMILKRLILSHFKNYREATFDFHPKINVIYGLNGSGKTNLLESIYYLSCLKTFHSISDSQLIHQDKKYFRIEGHMEQQNDTHTFAIGYEHPNKKIIQKDSERFQRNIDYVGQLSAVPLLPSDQQIVLADSSIRRRWMDMVISQVNQPYLKALSALAKVHKERNATLKNDQLSQKDKYILLDAFDQRIIPLSNLIFKTREAFITQIHDDLLRFYEQISNGRDEDISIHLKSQLTDDSLEYLLAKNRQLDLISKRTNAGVHKDDITFRLGGELLRKRGSQGQQKTFVFALRLTQYLYIHEHNKNTPFLLLDDIFDKLDQTRVEAIIEVLKSYNFGQLFITDTELERIKPLIEKIHPNYGTFEISRNVIDNAS